MSRLTRTRELAVASVDVVLRRPALFCVMFGNACDEGSEERVRAAGAIHEMLRQAASRVFPETDADALASAGWALAHGMAYLHMDGKLPAASHEEVSARVRAAFAAIVHARPAVSVPEGERP